MKRLLCLTCLIAFGVTCAAQKNKGSNQPDFAKMDSASYQSFIVKVWTDRFTDTNKIIRCSEQMLQNKSIKNKAEATGDAYRFKSFVELYLHKNPVKGLAFCDSAILHANQVNNNRLLAECNTLLAGYYYDISKFETSIIYYSKALSYAKRSQTPSTLFRCYNNIANVYQRIGGNTTLVQENYSNAINCALQNQDYKYAAFSSANLAEEYAKQKQTNLTQQTIQRALYFIEKDISDSYIYAATLFELGTAYFNLNQLDSAEYLNLKALSIFDTINRITNSLGAVQVLANIYLLKGDVNKSLQYSERLLQSALSTNNKIYVRDAYKLLAQIHEKNKQYEKAYHYAKLYQNWSDSINTLNNSQTIAMYQAQAQIQELQFNAKEKIAENKRLKEKNNSLLKQRLLSLVATILFAALCATLWFAIRRMKKNNAHLAAQKQIIEQQSNERGTLIQEIHHRVKNNLSMLQSLQYLQARSATHDETKQVLHENQARIQSMALVHQNLYDSHENEKLTFKSFCDKLCKETIGTYNVQKKDVTYNVNGDELLLPLTVATPLALMINELLTNSLKYAFETIDKGHIQILLEQKGNNVLLQYADNGKGLPAGINLQNGGFGFRLLNILSQQINGSIEYKQLNQTSNFEVRFSLV